MISIDDWKLMSRKEQALWLEENCKVNGRGGPRSLVYGAGVNDAQYCIRAAIDGKNVLCPAYDAWSSMINRTYSAKFHAGNPTYMGVTVCDEWLSFMSFRRWWMERQVDGWQLDKDILSDSREYSPEACIFAPSWLNSFTADHGAARGDCPIGVHLHKRLGRFQARCRNPMPKKTEHLGYFGTPEEAHLAWLARKLEIALELKPKMDEIDLRIYPRVVEIIRSAK